KEPPSYKRANNTKKDVQDYSLSSPVDQLAGNEPRHEAQHHPYQKLRYQILLCSCGKPLKSYSNEINHEPLHRLESPDRNTESASTNRKSWAAHIRQVLVQLALRKQVQL